MKAGLGVSFALIVVLYSTIGAVSLFLLSRWFVIETREAERLDGDTRPTAPEAPG